MTAAQLVELGLGSSGVSKRVRRGSLHRLHRGVYAVGHSADSWHKRWMAAVLASRHGIPVTTPARTIDDLRGTIPPWLWRRAERLAVEVDSYRYHRGRIAFQDDHARDLDLRRAGLQVRRFDEVQITERPELVLADLRDGLRRQSGSRRRGR